MAKLQVELVTAEGRVLSTEADFVKLPGRAGELGVLPRHIPLLTPLKPGEVLVRNGNDDQFLFVAGGFVEIMPDRVVILADVAEHVGDIDEAGAQRELEEARQRVAHAPEDSEALFRLELSAERLRVAEIRRGHHARRGTGSDTEGAH
ncbi:MAG: ATP synthase F1 subunit epsilon [Candidatus Dormibacteria bacterium]